MRSDCPASCSCWPCAIWCDRWPGASGTFTDTAPAERFGTTAAKKEGLRSDRPAVQRRPGEPGRHGGGGAGRAKAPHCPPAGRHQVGPTGGAAKLRCRLRFTLDQKKRRLHSLKPRLVAARGDHEAGRVRLCFGGKRLFQAQFHLKDNGFADLAAWRTAWRRRRSSQFLCLGSQDETAGNRPAPAGRPARFASGCHPGWRRPLGGTFWSRASRLPRASLRSTPPCAVGRR